MGATMRAACRDRRGSDCAAMPRALRAKKAASYAAPKHPWKASCRQGLASAEWWAMSRGVSKGTAVVVRLVAALGLGLAAAGTSACADPKVSMAGGPREYTDSDYPQVLERWTRTKTLT